MKHRYYRGKDFAIGFGRNWLNGRGWLFYWYSQMQPIEKTVTGTLTWRKTREIAFGVRYDDCQLCIWFKPVWRKYDAIH